MASFEISGMSFWPALIIRMVYVYVCIVSKDEMSHCLRFSVPPGSRPNKFLDSISKCNKVFKVLEDFKGETELVGFIAY